MKRMILKLSGEVFAGGRGHGIDDAFLAVLAEKLADLKREGFELAIVIGAGNFWRGRQTQTMEKSAADHMGMLGTIMNSIALCDALNQHGVENRLYTAFVVEGIGERYNRDRVDRALRKGYVAVLAGGTGAPFFSTDSGVALRACELGADRILLAKNVDGVYDKDPALHPDAARFDRLTYDQVVDRRLRVMDLTATMLCMENNIPIHVFDLTDPDNILRAARGEHIGTLVTGE